jgi:hypothetical protein
MCWNFSGKRHTQKNALSAWRLPIDFRDDAMSEFFGILQQLAMDDPTYFS